LLAAQLPTAKISSYRDKNIGQQQRSSQTASAASKLKSRRQRNLTTTLELLGTSHNNNNNKNNYIYSSYFSSPSNPGYNSAPRRAHQNNTNECFDHVLKSLEDVNDLLDDETRHTNKEHVSYNKPRDDAPSLPPPSHGIKTGRVHSRSNRRYFTQPIILPEESRNYDLVEKR
jgi:hypothetical protein